MELAVNYHNVDSAKQLAPNTEFDEGLEPTWFQKVCIWFNGIPNWAKVLVGGGLLIASIFINWPVMGLGLGFAAIYSLLQLTLGIGLGVLGYTLNGLFSGNWSVDSLQTEIANSIFFVGVTVFISSVCSAIKYAARSRTVTAAEFVKNPDNKTAVIGKMQHLKNYELQPGEYKLADLLQDLGSPKANWKQNSSVLRKVMQSGRPIKDISVMNGKLISNTGILSLEREILSSHGWIFSNGYWILGG